MMAIARRSPPTAFWFHLRLASGGLLSPE